MTSRRFGGAAARFHPSPAWKVALEIEPSEAIALTVRGAVANWYEWNPEEAERLTRKAFELAPGLVECARS